MHTLNSENQYVSISIRMISRDISEIDVEFISCAYYYIYGADNNRRWSKDIANDLWTWFPCGVACGAGEMVEETSDLTGSSWSTSGQYQRAGGGCSSLLIRRKSSTDDEYHHGDLVGNFDVITNQSVNTVASFVLDNYRVFHFSTGSAQSVDNFVGYCGSCNVKSEFGTNTGLVFFGASLLVTGRAQFTSQNGPTKAVSACDGNKTHPDPTKCQDCCDEYIQGWAVNNIKKYPKDVAKCIAKCAKNNSGDNTGRGECIKECFVDPSGKGGGQPSIIPARIYNYLICCYSGCDAKAGKFDPGKCKGQLSESWIEKLIKWL